MRSLEGIVPTTDSFFSSFLRGEADVGLRKMGTHRSFLRFRTMLNNNSSGRENKKAKDRKAKRGERVVRGVGKGDMLDEKLASVPRRREAEAIRTRTMERGNESSSRRKEKQNGGERRGTAAGGRQIRNEFFCFEHPEKRSNGRENDPRLLLGGGRATQRRGKRRNEVRGPFASAKPFLQQPCMQPLQESQTRH